MGRCGRPINPCISGTCLRPSFSPFVRSAGVRTTCSELDLLPARACYIGTIGPQNRGRTPCPGPHPGPPGLDPGSQGLRHHDVVVFTRHDVFKAGADSTARRVPYIPV